MTRDDKNKRPKVALLEARMSPELARLVEKHGGTAVCVPALAEVPVTLGNELPALLDELARGAHEIVVFMTGAAISLLFEAADQLGRRAELVASLKAVTTICRGPKPSAALRGFGVPATLNASEPFTAAELIDALSSLELVGKRVLLFNYGERSETLSETLLARRAVLREFWLYRWKLPDNTAPLEALVQQIAQGEVSALAVTCQIQFRHLYQVAERIELETALVRALNARVLVGAVGPTTRAILEAYGVQRLVVPEHPKMGPLIVSLMRQLSNVPSPSAARRAARPD